MSTPIFRHVFLLMLIVLTGCAGPDPVASESPVVRLEALAAFEKLEQANHWRERGEARDELLALGEEALEVVLDGTKQGDGEVRATCYEILLGHFAGDERITPAILEGLEDSNVGHVAYPCAFHIGEVRLEAGRSALQACLEREGLNERLRYAAIKSLGELGEIEMITPLWHGLGSEDAYTRYLSNLGMQGLTGRDLGAFGHESPWEGAFVSGPTVVTTRGQPVEKARSRARRWEAIAEFSSWLETDKPELFAELEATLW